jgi:hypothetical protein
MIIYEKRMKATKENAIKIMEEQDDFMSRFSVDGTVLVRERVYGGSVEYAYLSDMPPDKDSWNSSIPLEEVNSWTLPEDKEIKYLEWDFGNAAIYATTSSIDRVYRIEVDE